MAAALPTSRHLEINGLKFHYLDWGGDGPPLVMLHGLTGHAHTWDHTAAALSARYHVYALDQRGHGDTDWASRYGIPAMLGDLLGFLDALQLPVVTLMGLSMGGIVAYQFTAAHPERVSRLVVLDIGPEIASLTTTSSGPRTRPSLMRAPPTRARRMSRSGTASRTTCGRCRTARSPTSGTRRCAISARSATASARTSAGRPGTRCAARCCWCAATRATFSLRRPPTGPVLSS